MTSAKLGGGTKALEGRDPLGEWLHISTVDFLPQELLITSIAAVTARRAVRRAQSKGIQRLLDEVLLSPDTAALLLKENNPTNRAALVRRAKGWMSNEASTLIDILDEQSNDDLKGTIMRGRNDP